MKAPDKIYLPVVEEEGKCLLSTIWWSEDNRTSNEKFVVDAIPYIRKDALLEWAKKKYDSAFRLHLKKGDKYHYGLGKMDAYKILMDKIKSI